ncbi:related to E.coli tetracycline resistance protein TCR1 [Rhynchosporium graminicola]|uniref:Related to E.coli tetracycline resistance protein TCR1 n=1 Tax=Rhynchosporium graminicola TaxID=2792576 RepID=A0A1E1L7D5_9HELO|nr:related to E.coli tetracycline resistance protein TCR1 [Rhynchosporium commune]
MTKPSEPNSSANYGTIENRDTESSQPDDVSPHGTDYSDQALSGVHREPSFDRALRSSLIVQDEDPLQIEPPTMKKKEEIVTWSSLPRKSQLAILTLARLSEPLVQTSLRSYLFYQLRSFDQSLPASTIASQAGIMQGSFAAAQLCTAMLWGRFSDRGGRKRILLIGLSGTTISCIGFGFSQNFYQALCFRMLGGALNGNVGVMRTMISEIVREKKFQSRAFLILPMVANIGSIIGPMIGGFTSNPAGSFPEIFGGIWFFEQFPYASPNLISATFLFCAAMTVFFGLEETHEGYAHQKDIGITCRRRVFPGIGRFFGGKKEGYEPLMTSESTVTNSHITEYDPDSKPRKRIAPRYKNKLPFRRIFTYNVVCTLICHGLMSLSMGTFQNIWYSFLSTPVYDPEDPPENYTPHPPFVFTGGIGLPPRSVGFVMAILGSIGITLQLFLYPFVNQRLGTVRSWRIFLYCFPVVYSLVPFLSLIPSTTPPPSQKTGFPIWAAISSLLFIQVVGRTFASPATTILINNCSPHPSVLGTIHGIGQSASSAARTVGPALGGWLYGVGLKNGVVGAMFWVLACVAVFSIIASNWVREGDGHEIRLDGDDEAEALAEAENAPLLRRQN